MSIMKYSCRMCGDNSPDPKSMLAMIILWLEMLIWDLFRYIFATSCIHIVFDVRDFSKFKLSTWKWLLMSMMLSLGETIAMMIIKCLFDKERSRLLVQVTLEKELAKVNVERKMKSDERKSKMRNECYLSAIRCTLWPFLCSSRLEIWRPRQKHDYF